MQLPRVLDSYHVRFGWAVGLFDGEGSIGIYNDAVMLRIAMTDFVAVEKFRKVVGEGTLRLNVRKDLRKTSLVWTLCSCGKVRQLLRAFIPFLVAKREAATIALRFTEPGRSALEKRKLIESLRKVTIQRRGRRNQFFGAMYRTRARKQMIA
jgi:hypothetical protein